MRAVSLCPRMAAFGLAALLLSSCASLDSSRDAQLSAAARVHLGDAATQAGADGFALMMYEQAAEKAPRSVEAQTRYVQALMRTGQLAAAQRALDEAVRNCGPDPELSMQRGRIELAQGEPSKALLDFTAVLAARPNDERALDDEAIALDMLGRHRDAEADYRKVLAARPDDESASDNLAVSLMLQGRFQEAVAVLAPVANLPGSSPRTRANMAVALAAAHGGNAADAPAETGGEVTMIAQALQRRPR